MNGNEIWVMVIGFVAVLGFLYKLSQDVSKDIADLRERMAKIEGLVEGFFKAQQKRNG